MNNKYRMQNKKDEGIDVSAETGDIKDIQRKTGQREGKLEQAIEWLIYLLIVFLLAWIAFSAPILK